MLTNTACKSADPKEKAYKLSDAYGLFLLVQPNGNKHWRHRYRYMGKDKSISYGPYPEVSLAEAREYMRETRRLLREGKDPMARRKKAQLDAEDAKTKSFRAIATLWHEHKAAQWSTSHVQTVKYRLQKELFPLIGDLPIAEITPRTIYPHIQAIQKRGANEMARRCLQYMNQIFSFAIAIERADRNPAAEIKSLLLPFKRGHYRALGYEDLPALLQAIEKNDARLMKQTRLALRLMLLTFVRTNELIHMRWREVDIENKVWIIPAERMKMRREHVVSLSSQAATILEELHGLNPYNIKVDHDYDWVFPHVSQPKRAMSNATLLNAIQALGFRDRTTVHGFRATAMTALKEHLGYDHEVVDRQLSHAPNDPLGRAYDRAEYLDQRKTMMQDWADHLDALAMGNVVSGNFKKVG